MIKYIPYPVTMGFTSGIAVLIFSTQIKDFLGLRIERLPSDFLPKMETLASHMGGVNWPTLALAAASLAIIKFLARLVAAWRGRRRDRLWLWWRRRSRSGCFSIFTLKPLGASSAGFRAELPWPHFPSVSWERLPSLFRPAITIALLAGIESLLCAVVADGMVDDRHDSNQELIAQGVANIFSPFFGGIPATGAIARTATNVRCGGRTPVAGMIHALTLLLIILAAAPLAKFIPLAALSCRAGQRGTANMGRVAQFRPPAAMAAKRRGGVFDGFRADRYC